MRKDHLLALMNKPGVQTSSILPIRLLRLFLESKPIKALDDHDNISFRSFINFIQKDYSNVAELFQPPYLDILDWCHHTAYYLLYDFIYSDFTSDYENTPSSKKSNPFVYKTHFKFEIDPFLMTHGTATVAALQDGNILIGTIRNKDNNSDQVTGQLMLYNTSDKSTKHLINDIGISTLAVLQNGNILAGTSKFGHDGELIEIILDGFEIKIINPLLNCNRISAIATLPNGNIVIGTDADEDENISGKLIFLDPSGNVMKASFYDGKIAAITALTNGNILIGINESNHQTAQLRLTDSSGYIINTFKLSPFIENDKIFAITVLPNEEILISSYDKSGEYLLHESKSKSESESEQSFRKIGRLSYFYLNLKANSIHFITHNLIKNHDLISSIAVLPNGKTVIANSVNQNISEICKPILTTEKENKIYNSGDLLLLLRQLLANKTIHACITFHKGTLDAEKNDTVSLLCKLPSDILKVIYAYVFPFPEMVTWKIRNPDCFPEVRGTIAVSLADKFAQKMIAQKFFSKPSKPQMSIVTPKNELEESQK